MESSNYSLRNTARLAGLLYFISAAGAIFGYMYISPKIIVTGDIAATSKNMLANESLFRMSIANDIISNILFLAVILLLYQLLNSVNRFQARLMAGLVIVALPVFFIADSLSIIALQIFKGNLLSSYSTDQAQDIAATLLRIGDYGSQLITFHWGLWLIPLGVLIYRSGFIPRILGVLLFINGIGYMISSATFILFPDFQAVVLKWVYPTYFIGELPLIFWLLIKGIKSNAKAT